MTHHKEIAARLLATADSIAKQGQGNMTYEREKVTALSQLAMAHLIFDVLRKLEAGHGQ